MKVEITKKAPEPKKDVPFVVNGVYYDDDTTRIVQLVHHTHGQYGLVYLGVVDESKALIGDWSFDVSLTDKATVQRYLNGSFRLLPNARLVIEG